MEAKQSVCQTRLVFMRRLWALKVHRRVSELCVGISAVCFRGGGRGRVRAYNDALHCDISAEVILARDHAHG